jgi:hypothetical protein
MTVSIRGALELDFFLQWFHVVQCCKWNVRKNTLQLHLLWRRFDPAYIICVQICLHIFVVSGSRASQLLLYLTCTRLDFRENLQRFSFIPVPKFTLRGLRAVAGTGCNLLLLLRLRSSPGWHQAYRVSECMFPTSANSHRKFYSHCNLQVFSNQVFKAWLIRRL